MDLLYTGYRADYEGLQLFVEQSQDAVKILIRDLSNHSEVWSGSVPDMNTAKDAALKHALKHLSNNPLGAPHPLPQWQPYTDKISQL
jgi:hypothetical protein